MKITKHKKLNGKDFYIVKDNIKGDIYLLLDRVGNTYALKTASKAFKNKKKPKLLTSLWNRLKHEFA